MLETQGGIGRRLGVGLAVMSVLVGVAAGVRADEGPTVPAIGESGEEWDRLCLGIAVTRWKEGDIAGAVEALDARTPDRIDGTTERADFLRATGLRELGDREAFLREAARLRERKSEFGRWLDTLAWIDSTQRDGLTAEGRRGLETTRAEIDAADRLRRAAEVLADGRNAESLLADVPETSAYGPRARHVQGLSLLEQDQPEAGREVLESVFEESTYERRRDVGRALGLLALEESRFDDAYSTLADVESSWRAERSELTQLAPTLDDDTVNRLWHDWVADGGRGVLLLDRRPTETALDAFTDNVLDLRHEPKGPEPPKLELSIGTAGLPASLPDPDPAGVSEVERIERQLADARRERDVSVRQHSAAEAAVAREAAYFALGLRQTDGEIDTAGSTLARADSIRAQSDEVAAAIDRVRAESLRRVAVRTADFSRRVERNRVLAESLLHYRIEGSHESEHPLPFDGSPLPAEVLGEEGALVASLSGWIDVFAERTPPVVNRSHEEIWHPRATDGATALAAAAARLHDQASALFASIDSTRAAILDPSRLDALRARQEEAEARVRELTTERTERRREVLEDMITGAQRSLADEGEAIAYGLAVATHERSLRDGSETSSADERFREATDRYRGFLADYPTAPSRSEIRFRLADVLMAVAREEFQLQMARFTDGQPTPDRPRAAFAPFVDYEPALELYTAILEEDPEWVHRDAVLFHAGMILSDDGDPAAFRHLSELVEAYPASPYVQEARLRIGDDLFLQRDFEQCVSHFEAAAAGPDPEHSAIALYKAGWAHYSRDHFVEGADAFRRLLDLYEENPAAAQTTDLRRETEDYLVHCLARAGGVSAFETLFDATGRRPYEAKTLASLSHLLRSVSLFEEAAAADRVWLERYPTHPEALEAARRHARTLERAGWPEAARDALLEWAPHFFAGSDWHDANPSPELRAEGTAFAQDAHRKVALHHHHLAKETNDARDWKHALGLYGKYVAQWPDSPGAPTYHYYAGEAAAAVGERQEAIDHFERAAASDTASFRADAEWQAITVRDEWYESAPDDTLLAGGLIDAIDRFVERHGDDARAPDLLWRKGHLATKHGKIGAAAAAFGEIVRSHPDDPRAPLAARYRAQSFYEANEFEAAGLSYSKAVLLAHRSGNDSLAVVMAPLIPHCSFRHAEGVQKRDAEHAAKLFEELTQRWPAFADADQALYRAGLAYDEAGRGDDALRVWDQLTERYPDGEYSRDAYLQIAERREGDDPAGAAAALASFAQAFPADADAQAATLRAIDLYALSGGAAAAEELRAGYLERFPEDEETALEFLESRARQDLSRVGAEQPISALLGPGEGLSMEAADAGAPGADLRRYLELAAEHEDLAAAAVLAEVHYHRGMEAVGVLERAKLTQPLEDSIRTKKERLENVLSELRSCAAYEVSPWNRAAAYQIGASLIEFGNALRESERPDGLSGDDLAAYEEVLDERSFEFFDKGEDTWIVLLRRAAEADVDGEWVERARTELWPRLASRFVHRPEVEHPIVPMKAPQGDDR